VTTKPDRKALVEQYKQTKAEAGVYRMLNKVTGQYWLASSPNLRSVLSKYKFAKNTGTIDNFWPKAMANDLRQYGYESFSLDVLELLEVKEDTTAQEIADELELLEAIWREKLGTTT